MSNTPKLTPRRHPSAPAPQHTLEYDGAQAPVLIRLPDLSTRQAAPKKTRASSRSEASATSHRSSESSQRSSSTWKGQRRRIDRSHSARRQQRSQAIESLDSIAKSRIGIAALVFMVAFLAYFLAPSADNSPADPAQLASDPWSAETTGGQPGEVQVVMPTTGPGTKLWPPANEANGQQGSPNAEAESSAVALENQVGSEAQSQQWADAAPQAVSHISPSEAAPRNKTDEFTEVAPAGVEVPSGVPARPVSNQTSEGGWPPDGQQPSSTPDSRSGVSSQPGFSTGPSHRTSQRPVDQRGPSFQGQPLPGARLNGISAPYPSTSDQTQPQRR